MRLVTVQSVTFRDKGKANVQLGQPVKKSYFVLRIGYT